MKIIIADEQPLFRDALIRVLSQQISEPEIIEVDNFTGLEQQLQQNSDIDYVFMDVHISGNSGLSGLATLRLSYPRLNIVIVSASESPMIVYRAIKLGAAGFVPKSSTLEIFADAISAIITGHVWLPAQLENPLNKAIVDSPLPILYNFVAEHHIQAALFYKLFNRDQDGAYPCLAP